MSIKRCVVIACVSFETSMIIEPAVCFGADEVHLFHYVRDPDNESGKIYEDFYEEVCTQIKDKLPRVKIVEHADDPVYDFQKMLRDLLAVIAEIQAESDPSGDPRYPCSGADILINSSAGTSQFSAAAIIASMMSDNVEAFTVGTRDYTIKTEDIKNLYYKNGRPVGLTEHTHAPKLIPKFDIEKPDKNLVLALRSFHKRYQEGRSVAASGIIQQLKDDGLWAYNPVPGEEKTDFKQKEVMFYQRHYLKEWISYGWVEKPNGYHKYALTDNGLLVITTFYTDE